ncbi:MAG: hypothetical protein ACOX7N_08495 [Lawsonibacter sp.]|jgi:hypothetical protein
MDAKILYEVYQTTRANQVNDLTIGLAMLKDQRPDLGITHEQDKAIRGFIARHGDKLARAYEQRDEALFAQVVAQCEEEDKSVECNGDACNVE